MSILHPVPLIFCMLKTSQKKQNKKRRVTKKKKKMTMRCCYLINDEIIFLTLTKPLTLDRPIIAFITKKLVTTKKAALIKQLMLQNI